MIIQRVNYSGNSQIRPVQPAPDRKLVAKLDNLNNSDQKPASDLRDLARQTYNQGSIFTVV